MPPFLPLPWSPIPLPVRQILAAAATALFVPMLMSAGMMVISGAQMAMAGQDPRGVLTGMDAQQWRARFLPCTMSPGAFLAFLAGLAPHPCASGSITIGSPNVLGEDMPFGMMLPFPFSNTCSDIPVVPNATVVAMSNVMVGVSLAQVLAQMAMALLAYRITKRVSRSRIIKRIGDPVDIVSGARVDEDVDVALPGPLPLTITRQHLSIAIGLGEGGVLGPGNRLCVEQRLESPPLDARDDRVWIWHTADLRTVELPWIEEMGGWYFDRAEQVEICRSGDDTWDITDIDGMIHRFERWQTRRARLAARVDRNGNAIRFVYDAEKPDRLAGFLDSAGRAFTLEYVATGAGRRLSAIWCGGHPARPTSRRMRRYAYDARGQMVTTAGPDGVETRYRYDDAGRIIACEEPSGYVWHWHYDGFDRVTHTYGDDLRYYYEFDYQPGAQMTITRDHAGNRTLWRYDDNRVVAEIVDPEGGIRRETWVDNSLVTESSGEELTIEREYDARGRWTREILVGGGRRTREYDARGFLVAEVGPTGDVTRHTRDGRGNPTTTFHPDGGRTHRRFDEAGRVIAEIGPDGIERTYAFDDLGNLVEERHDGAGTRHEHDPFGNVIASTGPDGSTRRFEYDVCGRKTRTAHPDGTEERWAYDGAGNCVRHVARDGGAWRYDFDGAGRKVRTHTPEGRTLTSDYGLNDMYAGHRTDSDRGFAYRYDRCDRLTEHATDDGVVDRYAYDAAGRLIRRDFADGSHIEWEPAPHGEPARTMTGDGIRQTFDFDPAARIVQAVELGPDALTREGRAAADAVTVHFTRRSDGMVLAEHGPYGAIKYGYAPGERLTRYRVGEVDTRIQRDDRGRPIAIDAPGGRWRIAHHPGGAVWTAPDGAVHRVGDTGWSLRDDVGRPVAAYAADFDGYGRCVGEVMRRARPDDGGTSRGYRHAFDFDRAGRLAGAVDGDGNRRLHGAVFGAGNRLLRDAHGAVAYDPRGRIIRRTDTDGEHRYRWDDLDRLTEVETADGTIYSYRYDAFCRLIERVRDPLDGPITRSRFIWAGDVLAGEDREDGTRVRYLRLAARQWTPWAAYVTDAAGEGRLYRLHGDVRGAVVAATTGCQMAFWAEYGPFGLVESSGGDFDPRLRLQGMWADPDTGLYFNRFRWYVPQWGRYLTPDPLGVEGNRNVYAYTDGDPLHQTDPTGLAHVKGNPGKGANRTNRTKPGQQGTEPEIGSTRHIDSLSEAANGSYTITFASGKKYHGKGGTNRARQSARRHSRRNQDIVVDIDHTSAKTNEDAFKAEAERLVADGGASSSTNYNERRSPGEKLL